MGQKLVVCRQNIETVKGLLRALQKLDFLPKNSNFDDGASFEIVEFLASGDQ